MADELTTDVDETDVHADVAPDAQSDAPETLAQALGEDGPGIAAEIEQELQPNAAGPSTGPLSERLGVLNDLEVTVTARLCAVTQPLGEVLSMTPGSVLDLGRNVGDPIELLANGVLVAHGEVVAVGSSLGVRITSIPNA
ncbi:MAG: FliM/FliN family flagellar motor switch protein [Acidimicrobiales bacterium]